MEKTFINPNKHEWPEIIQRPQADNELLKANVSKILADVKLNGDAAVKKYTHQFDGIELGDFKISEEEIKKALPLVDDNLKKSIYLAKENIEKFHVSQIEKENKIETTAGVICWRKSIAIEKIGLYIPGGTAPLFSTLLMLGIPALLAGCREIVVCTPADKTGNVNPVILFVANILGLKNIYKISGVQAIGAMAYGTESVPKVFKIFGPGNQYVTCAKQLVNSEGIATDMPAGPSEVAVYADENCVPEFVAADLLSQAEHGTDSQVLLIATSLLIIEKVQEEILSQTETLSRKEIIKKSLKHARYIVMEDVENAFELLNEYAPEHLIIASDNAEALSAKVINAGSVFLGNYSSESIGDYASGTNHTLPTNGCAKAYSGISLDTFVKKITFQHVNKEGIKNIGNAVQAMAAAEGLDAHGKAISIRLKN